MQHRQRLFAAALCAVLVVVCAEAAAGGSKPPGPRGAPPAKALPKIADRDGDKVFDDLEQRMASASSGARLSVIVALKTKADAITVERLRRAVGSFPVARRFSLVDGFAATLTRGQIRSLARRSDVVSVAANVVVRAQNEDQRGVYGVNKARADDPSLDGDLDGNPEVYGGRDVVVAVLDTGIDSGHADLAGKVTAFVDFSVPVPAEVSPYDDNGHGTHVAATIAGTGAATFDRNEQGVAPAAGLVGVKVLDAGGSGTLDGIIAGLEWVVATRVTYGIDVVNMSLGAQGCADGTDPLSQAVNNAVDAGLVVVVSAGNDGLYGPCTVSTPAAAEKAITIGATGDLTPAYIGYRWFTTQPATALNLAWFSSRGPTADGRLKPDLVAPGVAVKSAMRGTTTDYSEKSGTSMAAPFAAGVAALMLDADPTLTPAAVKNLLRTTATEWGPPGPDIDSGFGRIDAHAALAAAGADSGSPSVRPSWQADVGSLPWTGATADYPIVVTAPDTVIAASIVMPGWDIGSALPDFDLQLLDPSGQPVSLSEDILRQEDVSHRTSTTGTYTVRVVSYEGAGAFFLERSTLALSLVANAGAPQVLGTPMPGHTLTGLPGAWNGVPFPHLRSLWMRCFPDGFGCDTLWGANYPTLVVPQPSVAPQNTSLPPQVTGIQAVGETLVASSPGSWRNPDAFSLRYFVRAHNYLSRFPNPDFVIAVSPAREVTIPITFAYQWQRCTGWPPVCQDIPGQVSPSYLLTPADEGTRIQLRVRGTNAAGSTDAYAVISYPIAPPRWSPPRAEPPPLTPPPRPPDVSPPPPPPGGERPSTPLPDLRVTAVADPPPPSAPPAGTPITYTITVENRSDVYASLVTLTGSGPWNLTNFDATTPAGSDGASCTVTPPAGGNSFTCDLRALPAWTTKQVTVTGIVSAQVYMTFSTWATMLQLDANAADNSLSIIHA